MTSWAAPGCRAAITGGGMAAAAVGSGRDAAVGAWQKGQAGTRSEMRFPQARHATSTAVTLRAAAPPSL